MAHFNPFRPSYLADPYPALARLRDEQPVFFSKEVDAWIVTGYAQCMEVLHSPDRFNSDFFPWRYVGRDEEERGREEIFEGVPRLTNTEGADHTRKRAAISTAFSRRAVLRSRRHIEECVTAILDRIPDGEPFDFLDRVAKPLAEQVVLEVLGAPATDYAQLADWARAMLIASEPFHTEAQAAAGLEARSELTTYLEHLGAGSSAPDDRTALGQVLRARQDGSLSDAELRALVVDISLGDSLHDYLGNALHALLEQPNQFERLRGDDGPFGTAIHELARFDPPPQVLIRVATRDTTLGSSMLRAGHMVFLMVGAANRDPSAFPAPDQLDLSRDDQRHLSFGGGTHFCPGAPLSQLTSEVALRGIVARFGKLQLTDGGVERKTDSYLTRSLTRLTVEGTR